MIDAPQQGADHLLSLLTVARLIRLEFSQKYEKSEDTTKAAFRPPSVVYQVLYDRGSFFLLSLITIVIIM